MFFRGTPALILLYLVYYGLAQLPSVHDGPLWLIFANAFACAVIGLTLNHASYLVEILRGGLDAVPVGLTEASAALGISPRQTFIWIGSRWRCATLEGVPERSADVHQGHSDRRCHHRRGSDRRGERGVRTDL